MKSSLSVQEATEKVLEDLLGQHEAEKSKLSSSLAVLETTRTELEQRIAVLTDKLNEKNDDSGIWTYWLYWLSHKSDSMYLRAILCTFQISVDFYYVPVSSVVEPEPEPEP